MATLLIKCPHTGKAISTGIEIDPDSFADLPDVLSHVCPECGPNMHGGREKRG